MPLSPQHISELFAFTKKKLVHHHDLQVELVDHLASAIEEKMTQQPELSFDGALAKVYASFGLFGFAHVVQEKTLAVQQRNRRLWLQEAKSYFSLPRILMTIIFLAGLYLLGGLLTPEIRYSCLLTGYLVFSLFNTGIFLFRRRKMLKPLLLTNYISYGSSALIILFPQVLIFLESAFVSNWFFALSGTLLLVIQMASVGVSRSVQQQAYRLYPEAFA